MLDDFVSYWGFDHLSRWENEGDRIVSPAGLSEIQKLTGITRWPTNFPPQVTAKSGSFAKRLGAWHTAQFGEELDKKVLSKVGALAEANAAPASVMHWAIHAGIQRWNMEGTFRERGSCFYDEGSNGNSPKYLADARGISFCLYRPGGGPGRRFFGNYTGAGRVWLIPYKDDVLAINIYYENDNRQVIALLANLFEKAMGKDISYRSMLSRHINIGEAYVNVDQNNSNHASYVLYAGPTKSYTEVNIPSTRTWSNSACYICKRLIYRESGKKNRVLCDSCGTLCAKCGKESGFYGMTWLRDKVGWYCKNCRPGNIYSCHSCGQSATSPFDCDCGEGFEHEPGF